MGTPWAQAERLGVYMGIGDMEGMYIVCLLYTSDAADDMQCVDLGGRRIIKKL